MVKIAYIISAYKYPDQLLRLVHRLNTEGTFFAIHVDQKTDSAIYDKISSGLNHFSNVLFLKRHPCKWGDFGHVLASIKGIQALCEQAIEFDFVQLLTGQCYPIKSHQAMQEFLSKNLGKSFINYFPIPREDSKWGKYGGLDRVKYRYFWSENSNDYDRFPPYESWVDSRDKLLPFPFSRMLPKNTKFHGGSSYWCFSKDCAHYLYSFIQSNPKFVNFFKKSLVSDEIFFQTILLNSPLKDSLVNFKPTYTSWSEGGRHPDVFKREQILDLVALPHLFARKFDLTQDTEILDLLDQATI